MTFLRDSLGTALEFICIFFIARFYLSKSFHPEKFDLIFGLLNPIFIAMISLYSSTYIPALAQFSYLIYFIFINAKETLFNRLLHLALSYSTLVVFQLIIALCLNFFHLNDGSLFNYVIGNLLTLIALVTAFYSTPLNRLYSLIKNAKLPFRILFLDTYMLLIIMMIIDKIALELFYRFLPSAVIILSFILIANACILYYDQKLDEEHKTLIAYQQNLPIYESLIQQIRANQHEYSNRIQTLQNLPYVYSDYDSLCEALKVNTDQFDKQKAFRTFPLLQINMPLLAASLFSQYTNARKKDIIIQFEIDSFNLESNAPEYQLSDYMCILTQNAIENCDAGDRIHATLNSTEGRVHYEIRNPIKEKIRMEEISKFFHRGYTTKSNRKENGEEHGMGLYYLRHDIEKHGGQIGVDQITLESRNWIVFYIDV